MQSNDLKKLETLLEIIKTNTKTIQKATQDNLEPDKTLLLEQEKINMILDSAESDSRLVCVSEKLTGSHRVIRTCRTVGQIRRTREAAQDNWRANISEKNLSPPVDSK